jgi:fucose permease
MEDTFDVTLQSLGILLGAATLGHLFIAFMSGRLIPKVGVNVFIIGGSLLAGIGSLGYAISPSWYLLLVIAFFASMGSGILDTGLNTFVAANYNVGQMNWLHAFFGIGSTAGPLIVTFIVETLDQSWRWSYVVVVIFQVVVLTLLLSTRQQWAINDDDEPQESPETPRLTSGVRMTETLLLPVVLLSILAFFLYGGAEVGAGQLTNTLLVDSRNISKSTAGTWISLYWGSFTLGRMSIGMVAHRLTNIILMRTTLIGAILGAFMLWSNIADVFSLIGLILMGVAFAPMFPTLISDTAKRVGKRHAPNAIGLQIGFAGVGIAALPGLAGVLAENIDLEIIGPFLTINCIIMFGVYELILWRERQVPQPIPVVAPTD